MVFLVGIGVEDDFSAVIERVEEFDRAVVEIVVAVGGAESVTLAVVEIEVVAEFIDSAVRRGKGGVEIVAADDVLGAGRKRFVVARAVGDVIERAAGLRSVLEGGAAVEEFDPVHGVERRGVVGFRIAELVGVDRDSVAQDLGELRAVRVEPAVAEADQWRGFLGEQQAGGLGQRLAVVVADNPRLGIQIDDRSLLSGEDRGSAHVRQPALLVGFIGFRLGGHHQGFERGHRILGHGQTGGGESRRQPCGGGTGNGVVFHGIDFS